MTPSLLEMLRASLRSRTILYVAATIIPMVVVFTLLELSHRQEAAQRLRRDNHRRSPKFCSGAFV